MASPYQRADAIRDGIIADFSNNLATIKAGTWMGNCPKCYRVGPYPHRCTMCNDDITLYTNARRDLVSPYFLARIHLPPDANIWCQYQIRNDVTIPLPPPIEVNGWRVGPFHPWFTAWLRPVPNSFFIILCLWEGEWAVIGSDTTMRAKLIELATPPGRAA